MYRRRYEVSALQCYSLIIKKNYDFVFLAPFLYLLYLCGTLKAPIQLPWKYRLSALLILYLKVINHLVKFQGFSVLLYWKMCDFVFLASFSVHFWTPPWFLGWLLMANQFISFFCCCFCPFGVKGRENHRTPWIWGYAPKSACSFH